MRACLCWRCGKLCDCDKEFPNGRPNCKGECKEYTEAPPEPTRITHKEMAKVIGCPTSKIEHLVTSKSGIKFLTRALARKGITLTYEQTKYRIYFYKEEPKNGN